MAAWFYAQFNDVTASHAYSEKTDMHSEGPTLIWVW